MIGKLPNKRAGFFHIHINKHECGIAYLAPGWSSKDSGAEWLPCSKLVNHKGLCGYEDNSAF